MPMPPSNMRCFDIWAKLDFTYTNTQFQLMVPVASVHAIHEDHQNFKQTLNIPAPADIITIEFPVRCKSLR